MSGSVIIRHGHEIVDGLIIYNETPLSWEDADAKAGRRLDRRKAWAFIDDGLCVLARWTQSCSGCSYVGERGGGCSECGYHGVVRSGAWVPA
ncbi:MAG: hypothetical protein KYX66_12340 [Blastomonas fulva]|uniref:hypothetical protein n=1 Tax=Blastomonas fulva TaxID=1550728 RepID=UPI0024E1C38C|nr:hypothetical protein [Blastomonas fulva]MDK2757514.1 hypothetical protein [Blastomonas fulva]